MEPACRKRHCFASGKSARGVVSGLSVGALGCRLTFEDLPAYDKASELSWKVVNTLGLGEERYE